MPETQETKVTTPPPPTRRQFMTKSAAAVAGAAFISPALANAVYAAGSDKLKVGLVGCGGRGCGAASQAIHADEGAVLTGVCDLFKDQAENPRTINVAAVPMDLAPDQADPAFSPDDNLDRMRRATRRAPAKKKKTNAATP